MVRYPHIGGTYYLKLTKNESRLHNCEVLKAKFVQEKFFTRVWWIFDYDPNIRGAWVAEDIMDRLFGTEDEAKA